MEKRENYPELLEDLADQLEAVLKECKIEDLRASEIAFKAAERVREHWGGSFLYIPKGSEFEATGRNSEIWKKFNGHNHSALALEFGISEVHVYRLVKFMRRQEFARRQSQLFPENQAAG